LASTGCRKSVDERRKSFISYPARAVDISGAAILLQLLGEKRRKLVELRVAPPVPLRVTKTKQEKRKGETLGVKEAAGEGE
jgi:hypothetical protein